MDQILYKIKWNSMLKVEIEKKIQNKRNSNAKNKEQIRYNK